METRLGEARPGGAVSLADVRLLRRLRVGDADALDEVWTRWKGPVWAVCRVMVANRTHAVQLLARLYLDLSTQARGWPDDLPICCSFAGWLLERMSTELELPVAGGIPAAIPAVTAAPDPGSASDRLGELPPELRLVYVVDLMFRCSAAMTAQASGWSEQDIRSARSAAAWRLVAVEGA